MEEELFTSITLVTSGDSQVHLLHYNKEYESFEAAQDQPVCLSSLVSKIVYKHCLVWPGSPLDILHHH